ncbi:MAG TPA: hypothetical protein ENN33_06700 [Ignavibacteria bacterium]|nr:hypothetical protein [Ignavibacteria bacterium]
MSREKLKNRIKNVSQQIDQIVNHMINISQMVGGSFGITYRRCGKPNCWCNNKEKPGHPLMRITFNEQKKSKSKTIPANDKEWIKEMTDNYRYFRQNFQKLRQCENKLNELLNQFEQDVKMETKGLRDYLKTM